LNNLGIRGEFTDNLYKLLYVKNGLEKINDACSSIIEYSKDYPEAAKSILRDLFSRFEH
jgi:hypothetical protein